MFAANAYEHVLDTNHWHFFETKHLEWAIPWPLTKYKILMLAAAALIMLIFIPLARAAQSGKPPRGLFWNAFESLLTFVRDQLAKPYLGHDADKYVHYLWTVFLFILFLQSVRPYSIYGITDCKYFGDRSAGDWRRSSSFMASAVVQDGLEALL